MQKISKSTDFENGFSLVSVMVAIGVGSIFILMFSSALNQIFKSQKLIAQKYEVIDLKQSIISTFQKASTCTCLLTPNPANLSDPANVSFNATHWDNPLTAVDESTPIVINNIKSGCNAASPVLLTSNAEIPNSQTGIEVDKIQLTHLQPVEPGLPANQRLDWLAKWEVSFKPSSSIQPLQPIIISQKFKVKDSADSPESNRKIDYCMGSLNGISIRIETCNTTNCIPMGGAVSCGCVASCLPDEALVGGGFDLGSSYSTAGIVSNPVGNGWQCQRNNNACSGGANLNTGCDGKCYAICGKAN